MSEQYEKRIEICKQCPEHQQREIAKVVYIKCTKCGCNMNMKARFPGMKCPLNKW